MKKIKLTQCKFALVDDEDFEELNKHKWHAYKCDKSLSFYARRTVKDKDGNWTQERMHRRVMRTPSGLVVDHLDHNTLNNQKSNLENTTHQGNMFNKIKYKSNTTGVTGVYFYPKAIKKWKAGITLNGKNIHLGAFSSKEEAIKAREKAVETHYNKPVLG